MNISWGGMKRLMEEVVARNTVAIHYSASIGIWVGEEKSIGSGGDIGFWPMILESFSKKKLKKEEANQAKQMS